MLISSHAWQDEAVAMVDEAEELTDALRTQVLFAREYLKSVSIGPKQVLATFPAFIWTLQLLSKDDANFFERLCVTVQRCK